MHLGIARPCRRTTPCRPHRSSAVNLHKVCCKLWHIPQISRVHTVQNSLRRTSRNIIKFIQKQHTKLHLFGITSCTQTFMKAHRDFCRYYYLTPCTLCRVASTRNPDSGCGFTKCYVPLKLCVIKHFWQVFNFVNVYSAIFQSSSLASCLCAQHEL